MDRHWICGTLFSQEHVNGVKEFMNFIQAKFSEDEEILYPCRECLNHKYWHQAVVNKHILTNGMQSTYTRWIYHGEDFNADVIEHLVDVHDSENGNNGADRFEEMFGDLRTAVEQDQQGTENEDGNNDANPSENESFLKNVWKEAKRHLYHGCTKFSMFSFVEICGINRNNRAQVKFHQTTGSRSYHVHCDNLGDKYKEKEPTTLDLFKECHYSSKKKGYTDVVQAAIMKWKRMPLNLQKMANNPTLQPRLWLKFLLSTLRSQCFLRMWGSSTCMKDPVVATVR